MALPVLMIALCVLLLGPAGTFLDQARWQSRAPRAAIALWQSIGLAGGLCAIGAGLSVAVARFDSGFFQGLGDLVHEMTGRHPLAGISISEALGLTLAADVSFIIVGGLALTLIRTVHIRARHRRLLDLVGGVVEQVPGTVILDHPRPTAYCLPGLRSRIVVSSGALCILDPSELAAVVSHEQCHARERHGLLMLPFASLAHLFSWIPYSRRAPAAVARLIELAADDHAARRHDPLVLASALAHIAATNCAPACAFGAGGGTVSARVQRLLVDSRTSRPIALATAALSAVIMAMPLGVLLWT